MGIEERLSELEDLVVHLDRSIIPQILQHLVYRLAENYPTWKVLADLSRIAIRGNMFLTYNQKHYDILVSALRDVGLEPQTTEYSREAFFTVLNQLERPTVNA